MKKLQRLSLFVLAILPIVAVWLIPLGISMVQVRNRNITATPGLASELVSLEFAHPDSVDWLEEGKEFRYEGHLYDVRQIFRDASGIHIIARPDFEESGLLKLLARQFGRRGRDEQAKSRFPDLVVPVLTLDKSDHQVFCRAMCPMPLLHWNNPLLLLESPPPERTPFFGKRMKRDRPELI